MEKQICLHIKENRYIDREKMPVTLNKYLLRADNEATWQRIREYAFPIKGVAGFFTGKLHFIFDDRWSLPISPYKNLISQERLKEFTDKTTIFHNAFNSTKELSDTDKHRAILEGRLGIALILIILGFTFLMIATANLDFKSWGY